MASCLPLGIAGRRFRRRRSRRSKKFPDLAQTVLHEHCEHQPFGFLPDATKCSPHRRRRNAATITVLRACAIVGRRAVGAGLLPLRCFDYYHCAGLRTLFAFLFGKTDLRAYFQLVESTVEHAIAVKVNFATIGSFEEAIA